MLVAKNDGTTRFRVDYSKLNDVVKKDSYPLQRFDILSTFVDQTFFDVGFKKWLLANGNSSR